MGEFLTIPHSLHNNLNHLSGNAFQVYLIFLRCITFQPHTRRPAQGSDFFGCSYVQAKKQYEYSMSKAQFFRAVTELIENGYVEKQVQGHFQGGAGKKQNLYRLLRF